MPQPQPDTVANLLNDVAVMARPDWLGSEPALKDLFAKLEPLRKQALATEAVLKYNQDYLIKEYGQSIDPDKVKPKDRPRLKKMAEAVKSYHQAMLGYQAIAYDLINKATPILIERLAGAYNVSSGDFIHELQQTFSDHEGIFETIPELMLAKQTRWTATSEILPSQMLEDVAQTVKTFAHLGHNISALFQDPKTLVRFQEVLTVKETARDHIMIRLMGAMASSLRIITDETRRNVEAFSLDSPPSARKP